MPEWNVEATEAHSCHLVVPARIERGPEPQHLGHGEAAIERPVLGDEANPTQNRGIIGGRGTEDAHLSYGRRQEADGQIEQGALAGAIRSDQGGDATGGNLQRTVL